VRPRDAAVARFVVGRETIDYVWSPGWASLVWLANLAALELHVPQWKSAPTARHAS